MAAKKRRAPRKRRASGKGRKHGFSWFKWILGLTLLGVMLLGGYSLYLSQVVRVKFEGKRWAVPAKIYARPLELYAGATLKADQLADELSALGYRKVTHPQAGGQWSRARERFLVRTRSFRFWDEESAGQFLELRFAGDTLASLKDAASNRDLDLVRLEPALIGSIYPTHNEDRVLVKREELPDHLVNALLAVEDRKFFQHHGVDPLSILRAVWANLRAGRTVQGGSTLTQQLVKNFFLSNERSLSRKLNEALMALILDARYDKDEILEAYANEIFLGQDGARAIHGFGLASYFYFNRPVSELSLPEAALLVGLVKGASYYNPRRHPERARERRDLVLDLMAQQGFISEQIRDRAKAAPLGFSAGSRRNNHRYPAFIDLVRRQLRRDYREEDLTSEGLRIFTTLDPQVQQLAQHSLEKRLANIEAQRKLPGDSLQGAVVVVTPQGGEVKALVGDRDGRVAGFNRALDATRPIGSLIKPAVYLTALAQPQHYSLVTLLDDGPIQLRGGDGQLWEPKNFDERDHGMVPLIVALADSYNQATVRLGMALGLDRVIDTLEALGVRRPLDRYPSLLLGAASLSPLEVSQLYQALAADGFRSPLRAIREVTNAQGTALQRYPLSVAQAVDASAAFLLKRALVEVMQSGTGRSVKARFPADTLLAGKTGTTDDLRDSWFAGFSADWVGVVWVGRDNNQPTGLTGSSGALQVWSDMMAELHPASLSLAPPEGIGYAWVDLEHGLLADEQCEGALNFPFIRGSEPREASSCRKSGLGGLIRSWLE